MSLCAIAVYLSSSSDAHVVKAIVTLLILYCWIILIAFYLRCAKGPQRVFTDYLHKALFISAEWWLTGNWETEVWHMARWAAFNILLISPSRWSTIISMHFIVGTREKDRQVQFRFIARLLIDPAVHKLHTVSLRPLDLLPVYHHTKVTFSAAPGSAVWASWEASWKVFTN